VGRGVLVGMNVGRPVGCASVVRVAADWDVGAPEAEYTETGVPGAPSASCMDRGDAGGADGLGMEQQVRRTTPSTRIPPGQPRDRPVIGWILFLFRWNLCRCLHTAREAR